MPPSPFFGVDEEDTRRLILKKTWCHGQLVLPLFAAWYLWLFFQQGRGWSFLYAAIVLPCWSYLSWTAVSSSTSAAAAGNGNGNKFPSLVVGGILAELAHLAVLANAVRDGTTGNATNLLLAIASGLLLFETAAFLFVLGMCGGFGGGGNGTAEQEHHRQQSYNYDASRDGGTTEATASSVPYRDLA